MKRRAWKWALGLLAGAALAVGGLLWSAHRRADAVFQRHDVLVKEMIAAIRARPIARPALDEPQLAGNGWSAYMSALAGFGAIPTVEEDEIPVLNGGLEFQPDREKLALIFGKYAPLVEELRKAGRYEHFVPGYEYEAGLNYAVPNASEAIKTARYLAGLAEFLHEDVQDGPASELLVLGMAMGHDTGRGGAILNHLVMIVCEGVETWTMRDFLGDHSFEAATLESLSRKMDRLWDARPSIADAFFVEDVILRRTLVDLGTSANIDVVSLGMHRSAYSDRSWRYLFSRRLAYAGALGEIEQLYREEREVSRLAPHLRIAAMSKASERVMESKNPIVVTLFPSLSRVFLRDRVAQMNWTLMRVATAIAWYESEKGQEPGKLEELVPRYLPRVPICPLTGLPLGYRDGILWSAGRNGVDDGGTPGRNNDPDDEDGDVVWRVMRE